MTSQIRLKSVCSFFRACWHNFAVKRTQNQWIGMDSVINICKYHFLCFVTIIQIKIISGHQVERAKPKNRDLELRCMFLGQIFAKNAKMTLNIIQTEAERRRREAGVNQSMEIRLWSCMYVCMVFGIISRTKARSATNGVPKCRSPQRALFRHHIIGVRLPTSARRAKLPK